MKNLFKMFVVGVSVVSPLYGGVVSSYKGNYTTSTVVETANGLQYEYALNKKVKDVDTITINTSEALNYDKFGLFNIKGGVIEEPYMFFVSDKIQNNGKITLFTTDTTQYWGTITLVDKDGVSYTDKCITPGIPELGTSLLFVFGLGLLALRVKH